MLTTSLLTCPPLGLVEDTAASPDMTELESLENTEDMLVLAVLMGRDIGGCFVMVVVVFSEEPLLM